MNKKVVLILLAIIIACCVCLAAAGILAFLFYAGDEFATSLPDQDQAPTYYSTSTPTSIFMTPTVEQQPNIEEQENYIDDLIDEVLICQETTVIWIDIENKFNADSSLFYDEQAIQDFKDILEQVRTDCASFTVIENPPIEYESINNEVRLMNEYGVECIDYFLLYLDTKESTYYESALEAAYEMSYHLEQLGSLVQELTPAE